MLNLKRLSHSSRGTVLENSINNLGPATNPKSCLGLYQVQVLLVNILNIINISASFLLIWTYWCLIYPSLVLNGTWMHLVFSNSRCLPMTMPTNQLLGWSPQQHGPHCWVWWGHSSSHRRTHREASVSAPMAGLSLTLGWHNWYS